MRQYFAIIKDSFRAAMASRVLYVLLALITILLLALAPFHYSETLDWKLMYQQHVRDPGALIEQIIEDKDDPKHPEVTRVWDQFPKSLQNKVLKAAKHFDEKSDTAASDPAQGMVEQQKGLAVFETHQELIEGLNNLIKDPDFYRPEDWKRIRLSSEIKELIAEIEKNPSTNQSRRLNRLLMGRAFRAQISAGAETSIAAWYGPWPFELLDLPMTRAQMGGYVVSAIPGILDKFVLSIGLAIALLVTASIIPETFEPGSLNLLLSKPISRSGLFLSKFVGGCVFIALCAVYLFTGIWLWLGLALGVWENAILYSIALYVIVFGIYYSVSALVGLVTRSTILSVIMTILFWGSCFFIGTGHSILNTRMQNIRVIGLADSGGEVVQLNRLGQFSSWDGKNQPWQSMMPESNKQAEIQMGVISYSANFDESRELKPPFGPVIDQASGSVVTGNTSLLNPLSFGRQPMLVSPGVGEPLKKTGKFPSGIVDLLQGENSVLAVTALGRIYRFEDPAAAKPDAAASKKKSAGKWFVEISPEEKVEITERGFAAVNRQNDNLVIYDKGTLTLFALDAAEGNYVKGKSAEIETETSAEMSCLVGYAGDWIALAMGNGEIILVDAQTLAVAERFTPSSTSPVEQIASVADGSQFFFRLSDQTLWELDTTAMKIGRASVTGQRTISAVAVTDNDQLLVADRTDRVTRYDLQEGAQNFKTSETYSPPSDFVAKSFRYAISPLYQLWPKPGEFYKVVAHLASTNDASADRDVDLRLQPRYKNSWSPLTSGLAFMAVMLAISCIYFSRKDY